MAQASDFNAKSKELKAKLRAEAEADPAQGESAAKFPDFDSQDWGRTESDDSLLPASDEALEAVGGSSELTASDQALMDELRDDSDSDSDSDRGRTGSDESLMSEMSSSDLLESGESELSWPDELTPGASAPAQPTPSAPTPPTSVAASPESGVTSPAPEATAALREELSSRSRETTLMQLAKQGVKNVKVLGMSTIEGIVAKAVATAIERSVVHHSIKDREEIEQEARREFVKLLKRHKKALSQGEDLAEEVRALATELAEAQSALTHEQRTTGPKLSPEAVAQLEVSFRRLLDAFMTDERRKQFAEDNPTVLKGLGDLEKKLGGVFDRLLDRVKSKAEELLERRIGKLNAALEETEAALRHLALSKGYEDGVASIYDSIQGLALSEVDYGRKKELLAIVFVENLEIQDREITEDDRKTYADALASLASGKKPSPGLKAPKGFSKPVETTSTEVGF